MPRLFLRIGRFLSLLSALLFSALLVLKTTPLHAQEPMEARISSPDGKLTLSVQFGAEPRYRLEWNGKPLLLEAPLQLYLGEGGEPAFTGQPNSSRAVTRDTVIEPVVPETRSRIRDHFNGVEVSFAGGWILDLRAYDRGVAYRYRWEGAGPLMVQDETLEIRFPGDAALWYPAEDSFLTHQERVYRELVLSDVPTDTMASIPVLAAPEGLPRVLITEADLQSYPGFYLRPGRDGGLAGVFPAYPAVEEQIRDRTVRVVEREPYLARTEGPRTFPWRVFIVAEEDRELVDNTLVYQLAPGLEISDPSWIRPGKVAWDWWNASSLYGVDFRSGLNTETYLHFIDFAAENGIEYIILDEGWSDPADLEALNIQMDLPALLRHGKEKGVGIILWVVWKTLADDMEGTMDRFARWGVAGIKVDFMQRDDQPMVEYYWQVAREASERHLLVDFHGAYKPTGLRRAYPNVLTREGVMGLEHSKWSPQPTPDHNLTLPFIRMVAGPMDYTPGAMRNAQERQFNPVFDRPMSLGTRVHQMAMYVVYESPLQMLADSPSNYSNAPECLSFIVGVPTVWDETVVLTGKVGDWIALARRRGEVWYLGAMTDWVPRDLELDLSFLGDGRWEVEIFEDGANAERNAEDYRRLERTLDADRPLRIRMGPGGGWAARLTPGG